MKEICGLLQLLEAQQPCNRRHLERTAGGRYKGLIDECVAQGLIEMRGTNSVGEDLYYITEYGTKILNNPSTKQGGKNENT